MWWTWIVFLWAGMDFVYNLGKHPSSKGWDTWSRENEVNFHLISCVHHLVIWQTRNHGLLLPKTLSGNCSISLLIIKISLPLLELEPKFSNLWPSHCTDYAVLAPHYLHGFGYSFSSLKVCSQSRNHLCGISKSSNCNNVHFRLLVQSNLFKIQN